MLNITAFGPKNHTFTGSSTISNFITTRIQLAWEKTEAVNFLTHLATQRNVAASTQNQALSAILFFYKEVLEQPLEWLDNLEHAKRPERIPIVFTRKEVKTILQQLEGTKWIMANLLYGSGLRLMECLRLRVKDVDFGFRQIVATKMSQQR